MREPPFGIDKELHQCQECGAISDHPLMAIWNDLYVCDVCHRRHAKARYDAWLKSTEKKPESRS